MAVMVATACSGTDAIRSESPEGTVCDDLVSMVMGVGNRKAAEGTLITPPHPISVRQLG